MTPIEQVTDIYSSDFNKSEHVDTIFKSIRLKNMYADNHYKHPFYPCIRDRGKNEPIRWGCEIHREVHNIHFDTIIHHMLFFEPEKHKEYIVKNLQQI